jgi:outer membrane protein TolC
LSHDSSITNIYELDRPAVPVYVGQQVDVFIKRDEPVAPLVGAASATNHLNQDPFMKIESTGNSSRSSVILAALLAAAPGYAQNAATPAATNAPSTAAPVGTNALPSWLTRPLSLKEAVDTALQQNGAILKAKKDLEASYGVAMQLRAIVMPKAIFSGDYGRTDALDTFPGSTTTFGSENSWFIGVRVVQSVYEGGRIRSSLRTANLTKEQAVFAYQQVVADAVTDVRVTYYNALFAAELIDVREASVRLLTKELEDTTRRFDAGTVPRFNVLRAEVELANARPELIRAKNAYRIAKNNLATLLGYDLPKEVWEDIPLQLTDKLAAAPYEVSLPLALAKALELRPELAVLRKSEKIHAESVITAKSGYLPNLQVFAGYGASKSRFTDSFLEEIHGYEVGAAVRWNIWDGNLTRGKVAEARALHEKSQTELDDAGRHIEQEVRTAYSQFVEAKEVLESQKKVSEQAEEALRLANSRYDAGTGTQLDVLSAQTALTEARSTTVEALRGYEVARVRMERAIGLTLPQSAPQAMSPSATESDAMKKEGVTPAPAK